MTHDNPVISQSGGPENPENRGKTGRHRHAERERLAQVLAGPALGEVGRYLRHCQTRALSANTIRGKLSVLRRLVDQLPTPPEAATFTDLEAWWALRSSSRAASTRYTELSHVRTFYAWLVRTRRRDDNPAVRLDPPKVARRHRQPRGVDRDQLAELLRTLTGRDRRAVALMALCGLRCAELAAARREHLERRAAGPVLWVRGGKGGRDRHVPVPAELAADLEQLDGYLVTTARGQPFTPHGVSDTVARVLRAHGAEATAHKLRHTYARNLYEATHDLLGLSEALGHSDARTTQVYARGDTEAMRAATDRLAADLLAPPGRAAAPGHPAGPARTPAPHLEVVAADKQLPEPDDDVVEQAGAAAWTPPAEPARQLPHRPVTTW